MTANPSSLEPLGRELFPGHVASFGKRDAERRSAVRIRDRRQRRRTTRCSPGSIQTPTSRSPNWRSWPMPGIRFRSCTERVRRARRNILRQQIPARLVCSWGGQAMWMPRVSGSWSIEREDRVQGGLRHVLRRAECHQFHAQPVGIQRDDDQRSERRFWADVAHRRSEARHLADDRSVSGTRALDRRFDPPIGDSLGANASLGARFQANNLPANIRAFSAGASSVQREISRNMAVEVAYNGAAATASSAISGRTICRKSGGTAATSATSRSRTC